MGRKRCPSYVESSGDEFELSDAEESPLFSRLKRPRRVHTTCSSLPSASPERNSGQREDEANSSVVIPDSLDQDDKSIAESVAESVPHGPKDPRDEDTRETERPSENGDDIDEAKEVEDGEDDDVVEVKVEADDKKDGQQSPTSAKLDNVKSSGRRRQARKVYQIESDSEEESDHDNDDDDAYNSAADSPAEDDDDSEFAFSPQKQAKKKEKKPTKRAPSRQKAQTPPARKLATRKLATRKLAAKPVLANSKASSAVSSISKPTVTSTGAKRQLGARLRHRGRLPPNSSVSDRRRPQSVGSVPSTPVIRSGLSRKAAIPRLHAYLPR